MGPCRVFAGFSLSVCSTVFMVSALHAQTVPSAGAVLKQNAPPAVLPAAPGAVIALPAPSRQDADAATPIPVRRIRLQGNTRVSTRDLEPLVKGLEGRTVTLGALRQAARRITALYQSRGYPLASAYIPAQRIQHGVVRIQVVEPTYDRINVQGHSRLDAGQARRILGLSPGQPIAQDKLERGLLLLNRTPGVRVAGTLVPGAQPATSRLQVRLTDTPMLHTRIHLDDYGSTYTGRTRVGVDLSLDNPLGHGAQAAVTTLATTGGLLRAGGFSLTSPDLADGLRAGIYGSRTRYRLGDRFAALGIRGRVSQFGLDLDFPLLLQPGRLLGARLDLLREGFDQHSTVTGSHSRTHIRMARLGLDGAWADRFGSTSGGLSLGRGALSLDNPDARLADASGLRAGGTFWVARLQLQREQSLPRQWRLRVRLSAQMSTHPLDGSEKFYLGGPYAVMSVPTGTTSGDAGALVDVRLSHALPWVPSGRLRGALLLQSGTVWLRGSATTNPGSTHLSGLGPGLDYQWKHSVSAHLAYVHGLGNARTAGGVRNTGEWWARLTIDL